MNDIFIKILFFRYIENLKSFFKVLWFGSGFCFFMLNFVALNEYVFNEYFGTSWFWSYGLVHFFLGISAFTFIWFLLDYLRHAIKYKKMNVNQWPQSGLPNSLKIYKFEIFLLIIGFFGVLAAGITVCCLIGFVFIFKKFLKMFSLKNLYKRMETKNQKFLEENPDIAIKIFVQKMDQALPTSDTKRNVKRI